MKKLLILIILLVFSYSSYSQFRKYGKIKKADWEINSNNAEFSTKIITVFDDGIFYYRGTETEDDNLELKKEYFQLVFGRHIRHKISGQLEDSTIILKIPLKLGEDSYVLSNFQGRMVIHGDQKDKKIKISRNNLHNISDKNGGEYLVFYASNIVDNAIIEFDYSLELRLETKVLFWSFHGDFPTMISRITYSIPDFVHVNIMEDVPENIEIESYLKTTEYYMHKTGNGHGGYYGSIRKYQFNRNYHTYTLRNTQSIENSENLYITKVYVNSINTNSVGYTFH